MIVRQLNQFGVGSPVSGIELTSVHGRVRLADYLGRNNVVLYWGRTFASSRFWLGAMILSGYSCALESCGAAVLMIGDESWLGPATRLASELGLRFSIVADARAKPQTHFLYERASRNLVIMTILVDLRGIVRFTHRGSLFADVVDGAGLYRAVRSLSTSPCAH